MIPASHNMARRTNHIKPRFQLYQPGFNAGNSCWVDGAWITLSEDEWEQKKEAHAAMYANLKAEQKKQYHRDPPTPVDQMTPAQKQAWQHHSGTAVITYISESGYVGPCAIGLQSDKIAESTVRWIKKHKWKIPAVVLRSNDDEFNQQERYDIPDEIVVDQKVYWNRKAS